VKTTELVTEPSADELYGMANLFPQTTGLPMVVWVSYRGRARHDVRIKVQITHGSRVNPSNMAVVGVRPVPRLIAGRLSSADQQLVFEWAALNTDALVAYWEGQIDTSTLVQRLKSLATGQPSSAP
jgi:hypothetical protein